MGHGPELLALGAGLGRGGVAAGRPIGAPADAPIDTQVGQAVGHQLGGGGDAGPLELAEGRGDADGVAQGGEARLGEQGGGGVEQALDGLAAPLLGGAWLGGFLVALAGLSIALLVGLARLERRLPADRSHHLGNDPQRWNDLGHLLAGALTGVLDVLARFAVVFAPLALVGAPPLLLPVFTAAILLFGPLSHANLDLAASRWLYRLVLTPDVHALHHARRPELSDANFAVVTPLWDVVFGTFRHPDDWGGRPKRYGIEGERWPRGFGAQLLAPLRGPERGGPERGDLEPGRPEPAAGL